MSDDRGGLRARGEDAVGELAQTLIDNPLFSQALSRALGVGERAVQAQRGALAAFDIATSPDIDRLERRIRALSNRIEELEDQLDSVRAQLRKQSK